MTAEQIELLARFGLFITSVDYEHQHINLDGLGAQYPRDGVVPTAVHGEFRLDLHKFDPNCHLLRILEMIVNSNNPAVNETFEHLITMLELTKDA